MKSAFVDYNLISEAVAYLEEIGAKRIGVHAIYDPNEQFSDVHFKKAIKQGLVKEPGLYFTIESRIDVIKEIKHEIQLYIFDPEDEHEDRVQFLTKISEKFLAPLIKVFVEGKEIKDIDGKVLSKVKAQSKKYDMISIISEPETSTIIENNLKHESARK